MRKLLRTTAVLTLLALLTGPLTTSAASEVRETTPFPARVRPQLSKLLPKYVPGEVLVEFKETARPSQIRHTLESHGATIGERLPSLDVDVVELPGGASVEEAVQELNQDPEVEVAEPNFYRFDFAAAIPDDPLFFHLWGLNNTGQSHAVADDNPSDGPNPASGSVDADIDALEAWDTQEGSGQVVAVLDTGVDVDHPDLQANIWTNPNDPPGDSNADGNDDDDLNGLPDDIHGWDFAEDDNTLLDTGDPSPAGFDHGTQVAGTIAALKNNGQGISGVCPACKIMVLKFWHDITLESGRVMVGTLQAELEALEYARRHGVDVLNASFTSPYWTELERRAFARFGRSGGLAVVAAGNSAADNDLFIHDPTQGSDSTASPLFPASYDLSTILSVAASTHKDGFGAFTDCLRVVERRFRWGCTWSNWGRESVDVAAPGTDIVTTAPGGGYAVSNGTSMAAPYASAVAALVKAEHPGYSPTQVKNAIMNSANRKSSLRSLNAFPGGVRKGSFVHSNGRVNANGALTASTRNATRKTDGNISGAKKLRRVRFGRVRWPADTNDIYKKRLRRGRYKVILNGPRNRDLNLVVWRPGVDDIWQLEQGCFRARPPGCSIMRWPVEVNDADETARFRVRRRGVFYIHVSAWLFNSGRYSLRVRRIR